MKTGIDIIIVGSGLIGATYAARLATLLPGVTILIVEAGPSLHGGLSARIGYELPAESRQSMLATLEKHLIPGVAPVATYQEAARQAPQALPGTHLVQPGQNRFSRLRLPAASVSHNLGGMGALWSCASPRLGASELPACITPKGVGGVLRLGRGAVWCITARKFCGSLEGALSDAWSWRDLSNQIPRHASRTHAFRSMHQLDDQSNHLE